MTTEIERLNDLLRGRLGEIENLKYSIRSYEEKITINLDQGKQKD